MFISSEKNNTSVEQPENYGIHHLIMVTRNCCMICGDQSDSKSCKMLTIGYEEGWIYCDKCLQSQRLRNVVLGYLNGSKTIPLQWLYKSSNENLRKGYYPDNLSHPVKNGMYMDVCGYLHFFRSSKKDTLRPVHSGVISHVMMSGVKIACKQATNKYRVYLCFPDNETGQCCERLVGLENIMAHTPGFYEELIKSDNLLSSTNVTISFSDLSKELQNEIHEAYKLSQSVDKTSFAQ